MLCRRAALSRSVRVPWTLHAMTPENTVHVQLASAPQCRSASGVATNWHGQISRRLNTAPDLDKEQVTVHGHITAPKGRQQCWAAGPDLVKEFIFSGGILCMY